MSIEDQAQDQIEQALERDFINHFNSRKKPLIPNGRCYFCGDDEAVTGCFCSIECRDDYQRREHINKHVLGRAC